MHKRLKRQTWVLYSIKLRRKLDDDELTSVSDLSANAKLLSEVRSITLHLSGKDVEEMWRSK